MRRSQPRSHDCNSCVAFKCKKINSEWPKLRTKHKMSAKEHACFNCDGYLAPKSWTVPILMHLTSSSRKIQALNDLLARYGISLQELDSRPYFKLLHKKARG